MKLTKQMKIWQGIFGKEYTNRNAASCEEMDSLYQKRYGISRTTMNLEFLKGFNKTMRILEVGSNVGNQLLCLQKMGFSNLYGIELQIYAVELSKIRTKGINIIEGSAFDIPFKDSFFELVFTSGLLIHIAPSDIGTVLEEIYRCSRKYIWGFEYYAERYTEINYRGNAELLWKTDFVKLYLSHFSDLNLVREERFEWSENKENIDTMFLLVKK